MSKAGRRAAVDAALAPLVWAAARLLRHVRRRGIEKFPRCRAALDRVGVFPVRDHYYEPRFRYDDLNRPLEAARALPGVDWDLDGQRAFLATLVWAEETRAWPVEKPQDGGGPRAFHLGNGSFEAGDAELLHQVIRRFRPRRIIEIGSGHSTLAARGAIGAIAAEAPDYVCDHLCVEPFEAPWLEATGVTVLRERVERLDPARFDALEAGDLLFIDSSHMIRPQGDVLFEMLEVLPRLAPGVVVHVHDIFSPRDYLRRWLVDEVKFWNEQYLLEAFLSHNRDWRVLAAANLLKTEAFDALQAVAPHVTADAEPGSIYLQRVA